MIASIKKLIEKNPSGLFEMKPSLTIAEYRNNSGFGLRKIFNIYQSGKSHYSGKEWFEFSNRTTRTLFNVREESTGDLLVVFIIETIKENRVYCNLVLSDAAYREVLNDKSQHLLQVHQMYTYFFEDHIKKNMITC